jgi:hypothetical protein
MLIFGQASKFFILFCQTCQKEITVDQLCTIFRKNSLDNKVGDFFPPSERDEIHLEKVFTDAELPAIYAFYKKQKNIVAKENIGEALIEMFSSSSPSDVNI